MKNNTMFQKLSALTSRNNIKTRDDINDPSPSPMNWKEDGLDHINIWSNAETELGKVLAHEFPLNFYHSVFGKFCSVESFWFYINSAERDDVIRNMSGKVLKDFSKKLTKIRVLNFRAIIMDSNWQRIQQYPDIVEAIKMNELPYDTYYVNSSNKLRVRHAYFKWFNKGFEEIVRAIKEDRQPDFSFLLDRQDTGIYDFVLPQQVAKSAKPKEEKKHHQQHGKGSLLSAKQVVPEVVQVVEASPCECTTCECTEELQPA
jgi:hypothetical protein